MLTFKKFCVLLEHDMNKTWGNFGSKIHKRMKDEDSSHNDETSAKSTFEDHINKADPTPTKKYGQWIAKTYASGGIKRLEDIPSRVSSSLETFHSKKHLLVKHGVNPDINQHKSLGDLEDAIDRLPKEAKSTKESKREESSAISKEADHHSDEHWDIKVPHTEKASCHYGQGTRWCTAASNDNMFKSYHKKGDPLHIFVPKKPKYAGEKYQLHIGSRQFMDEKDNEANLHKVFKDRPSEYIHGLIDKAAKT